MSKSKKSQKKVDENDENYKKVKDILNRLILVCNADENSSNGRLSRMHNQKLLKNLGAHEAIIELLQVSYDKVVKFYVILLYLYTADFICSLNIVSYSFIQN